MTCHYCKSIAKKHGRTKQGLQRFRSPFYKKTFCEDHERPLDKMRIKLADAVFGVKCLVEGSSVQSTERMTGLHRDTILDLLLLAGERCESLKEEKIRNVPVKQVQADEIWGYVGKKEKHKKVSESSNPFLDDATRLLQSKRIPN